MKKLLLLLSSLLVTAWAAMAQVTTDPAIIPLGYKGKVVVTFDPAGTDMAGQTTCYAHTGVTTKEKGNWTCAPAWKTNTDKYKLTKSGTKWVLTIDDLYTYYDCAKNMDEEKSLKQCHKFNLTVDAVMENAPGLFISNTSFTGSIT